MKKLLLVSILLIFCINGFTQSIDLKEIAGVWEVDLRPAPDADPYLKDFVIKLIDENHFKGEFYDTRFKNGLFDRNWGRISFGFTTSDGSGTYFHSGYLEGDKLIGCSYSESRDFIRPWVARRK